MVLKWAYANDCYNFQNATASELPIGSELPKFVDWPISSVFAKMIRDAFICKPSILN